MVVFFLVFHLVVDFSDSERWENTRNDSPHTVSNCPQSGWENIYKPSRTSLLLAQYGFNLRADEYKKKNATALTVRCPLNVVVCARKITCDR